MGLKLNYENLDKSSYEIITSVLDKYCVNYKTKENIDLFLNKVISYDVNVNNLKSEAYLFLTERINEKIKLIDKLEERLDKHDYIQKESENGLQTYLKNYFNDLQKQGIVKKEPATPFKNILKAVIGSREEKQEMTFEELPTNVKEILLEIFPLSVLQSKNVTIKKVNNGFSVNFAED